MTAKETSDGLQHSPLQRLSELGQSPWLDFIHRNMMRSGELSRMVERWGLRGVTSNPAIFEKAIVHSSDYADRIAELTAADYGPDAIYEDLVLGDIREAADALRGVHERTNGGDGFVSIEVSPRLVHDTAGTVAEAERFWNRLDRPNVMIKVPATVEGLPAIRQLIGKGINVNVTLLFSLARYEEVAAAYLDGLEDALADGRPLTSIVSVASFFLSRIDTLVDKRLESLAYGSGSGEAGAGQAEFVDLKGQAAIACARLAYETFCDSVATQRFGRLAEQGARPQRLLWASTSTKNPDYDELKYVEPLIARDTVSTMPLETLSAYDDHGNPAIRLTCDNAHEAHSTVTALQQVGIDLEEAAGQLLEEGIVKFVEPFESLHSALAGQ